MSAEYANVDLRGEFENWTFHHYPGKIIWRGWKIWRRLRLYLPGDCWRWGRCNQAEWSWWGRGRTKFWDNLWRSVWGREWPVHCCPPAWYLEHSYSVHSILRLPVTCSKIDYNVYQEDGVREAVEHHPPRGEIVVKEGNGHREDDEVGD